MTTSHFFQQMSDGTEVFVNRWIPDKNDKIKAVIQFNHGMQEHSMRYDRLGSILAENGYVFSAHDLRGHGKTAQKAELMHTGKFGYLSDSDGFDKVTNDTKEIIQKLKKDYPYKRLFAMGHSFGSFVDQNLIEDNDESIDGCMLFGTSGPKGALVRLGKILSSLECSVLGKDHYTHFLTNLSFGSYNKKIENHKFEHEWFSRDIENIKLYESDKWCGITPTASFFYDMTSGLCKIHKKANMKKISHTLPLYIAYGTDDPVSLYGNTIQKLTSFYKKNGSIDLTVKEYKGARHELLNEINKDEVISDSLFWIEKHLL